MLVAISECDSLCRPRHSICLQLLIKHIAYVHPGIPSYPSVKSPLLLLLLLTLPIPTSFPFPPSHLPPLPYCPSLHLLLTLSPSPLPTSSLSLLLPSPFLPPRCPLPDSPSLSPPPPVAIPPSPSPLLSVHPPHLPLPTPLPAFGPCQPLSILFPIAFPSTGS